MKNREHNRSREQKTVVKWWSRDDCFHCNIERCWEGRGSGTACPIGCRLEERLNSLQAMMSSQKARFFLDDQVLHAFHQSVAHGAQIRRCMIGQQEREMSTSVHYWITDLQQRTKGGHRVKHRFFRSAYKMHMLL